MKKSFLLLTIAYAFLALLFYSTSILGEKAPFWQNALYLFAPALAAVYAIGAFKRFSAESLHGKSLMFLSVSFVFWLIGELLWVLLEFLGIDAFPSIAD